jgi:hypothetical protein
MKDASVNPLVFDAGGDPCYNNLSAPMPGGGNRFEDNIPIIQDPA